MKRLFYLLFGLVLLPALLYAQGTLSLKDINDNLTNNYYNKIASDARYATTTYGYSSAEVDILLAPKADKTYVNATDEAIISDNDSQDVQIEANRVAITLKATQIDMDSAETAINANNIGDDSQDVTIEANRVGVASLEVGLQTHQNNPTGAHAATAISATWTNVQVSLDSLETAIQDIVVGSGFATTDWVNSTLETNFYTQAQTNATIEAAIAAIPTPSVNQTVTVTAGEALTAGEVVSLINESGTMKAYNVPLTVSTSPNGAESVFFGGATTLISAVALDTTRFLVAYAQGSRGYARIGTVSGSTISWGSASASFEDRGTNNTISACKIGTDKVLVVYNINTVADGLRMVVLSISGSTITVNTPADLDIRGYGATYASAVSIDTDKAVVCFKNYDGSDFKGYCKYIAISSTTPTPTPNGTTAGTKFNDAVTSYVSASPLSSTSVIVAYQDGGNSNFGTSQILSISGTTITPGTEYVLPSSRKISANKIDKLSSTSAFWFYADNDTGYGYARVCSISNGTEISYETEATVFSGITYTPVCHNIDGTKVLLGYEDGTTGGAPYEGRSVLASISGTSVSKGTTYTYNTVGMSGLASCYIGSQKSVFAYTSTGNSSYGTAVVNQWATTSYASIAGISQGAYSSGSDAVVLISGLDANQSGLITGSPYFLQSDFTIGTTPVSLAKYYNSSTATGEIKIGTAKSATELIVGIDYK